MTYKDYYTVHFGDVIWVSQPYIVIKRFTNCISFNTLYRTCIQYSVCALTHCQLYEEQ